MHYLAIFLPNSIVTGILYLPAKDSFPVGVVSPHRFRCEFYIGGIFSRCLLSVFLSSSVSFAYVRGTQRPFSGK